MATGHASIRGGSEMVRMILLNSVAIGITFTWGIEMTYCTPYLLDLGLAKSNVSLVWVAGPLSGLIVQPVVGVLADESTSRWGRRRPLMLLSAFVVAASLLLLGFTREVVGVFLGDEDDGKARRATIALAVFSIYLVDFAINAVMSCSRSLIVDTLPMEKQQTGAAWAGRMGSIGHVLGYTAGAVDLVRHLGPSLGDTQLKQLTVIAAVAIISSTALTCWAVSERVLMPRDEGPSSKTSSGHFQVLGQIYSTILQLPPRVRAICWAQFWSWIGWFPFLFYSTTWIGEIYFRYDLPAEARSRNSMSGDMGRIGSVALVFYSTVTFTGALLLPLFVTSPDEVKDEQPESRILRRLRGLRPDLLTAWIFGHLLFSAAMSLAPFARNFQSATILVCICGIPWTIALWAPTAFLGIEVNKLSASYTRIPDMDTDVELPALGTGNDSLDTQSKGELSGIYFGILNIFTTLPQFVGTFIATIVFAVLEPGDRTSEARDDVVGGPSAIAVCLFIGAMSSLVAAYTTLRLRSL